MDSHISCVESRRKIVGYINQVKILRIFGVSSATLFSLILLSSIFPIASHTDHVGAAPETSTTDITMVTGRSSANLDITPNSGAGTFATSTGNNTASFNVTTNSYTGYTLKILGSDTNGQLANAVYNTALSPIDSIIDGDTFAASSSNIYNNKWGIIPSKVNSQANTNYLPAPVNTGISSTTTEIFMNKTSCANGTSPCSSASDNYTIGIGARIDFTRPAGLYTKSFTLAAVGNPATYTINYSKGDVVDVIEGMPTNATTGSATDPNVTTISLDSATPTRANYDFAGWCLGTLTGTTANPGTTCNGTLITDRIFTLNQASDNEATLYATWTAKKFNVTIKTVEGISKVSLNGTECDKTTGCTVANLAYNNTYNLVATPAPGYTFSGWDPVSDGNIANTSNATTTYTVGTADATITPTATINKYNITIKTTTGISKVSLNGTECDKTSGCTVSNLTYGQSYELKATVASGYTFSSWNAGAYGSVAANTATTTYTVGVGDSTIVPTATINKYNITIKTTTGISKVSLNGTECDKTSGCTVSNLTYGQSYELKATVASGYTFSIWNAGAYGSVAANTAVTTTYTVGVGDSTITPTATINKYNITIKTATGISKVSLNGTECDKTSGCTVPNLTYGQSYELKATVASGYTFSSWNAGAYGSVAANTATTTYTVGVGDSIITPSASVNKYSLTVTFAGVGVSSVAVKTGNCSGSTMGTATSSSPTVANLAYNVIYYLCPTFNNSNYEVGSWSQTSATGTLSSNFDTQPTFTMGAGNGAVTITGMAARLWFQKATTADCGRTMYDKRGTGAYRDIAYTTTKIGNLCYMTRSLDLPGGTTLTPADSNVSANYTLPASNNNSSSFSDDNTAYVYNSNSTTCGDNSPCYSYYSYTAATAGTNPSSGEATSDICPKGWRLPTAAEYYTIATTYANPGLITKAPFKGVYSSNYYGGSFKYGGVYGYYWSSTASNSSSAYNLIFNTGGGAGFITNYKRAGNSIRCVFGPHIVSSVYYMQDITPTLTNNTPDGATATLIDTRDSKKYTVAKIRGQVWMTKNLDLAGGTTLTSANSNVSANYTLPASETISSGTTLANSSAFSDTNTAYVFNSGSTTCSSSSPCYSYYSYKAATAGTNPSSGDATSDICPKGWRLPTQAEYTTLVNAYTTGPALTAAPFIGVYAGNYENGSFNGGGSSGYYWSSTAYNTSYAYRLHFYSSNAYVASLHKRNGTSIRCIAK